MDELVGHPTQTARFPLYPIYLDLIRVLQMPDTDFVVKCIAVNEQRVAIIVEQDYRQQLAAFERLDAEGSAANVCVSPCGFRGSLSLSTSVAAK
jgi:hypothetical protein